MAEMGQERRIGAIRNISALPPASRRRSGHRLRVAREGDQMSNDQRWQDMTPDEQAVAIRQITGR
jgi:phage-related protein